MRVIICGTQNCNNYMMLNRALQLSGLAGKITKIITNNHVGIATLAVRWATERGVSYERVEELENEIVNSDACITVLKDYISILDNITRLCERANKKTFIFCLERDCSGQDFISGPYTSKRLKGDEE